MQKTFWGDWLHLPANITAISFCAAAFIVLIDNQSFWHNFLAKLDLGTSGHWIIALTVCAILVLLFHIIFMTVSFRPIFKPFIVGVLLTSAVVSYFSDSFGTVIDKSMIHNILETDVRESRELMTWPLFRHMVLYGVIPAALIILAPIRYPAWRQGLRLRTGVIALSFFIAAALFMANYKDFVLFSRQNRDLRMFINPSYPIYSLNKVIKGKYFASAAKPLEILGIDAVREENKNRSVVVLVLGETARSKQFALNGYGRNTNPYTSKREVISFTDVESCGTATAESVPCMFSSLGRDNFTHSNASTSENILDVLQRTKVKVVWRDNDSGSKGVADRIAYEDFSRRQDTDFCSDDNCYDEVLLRGLEDLIKTSQEDMLIVLHLKGSHGPSYYKRSPAEFKIFSPECTQDNVQECSQLSIINAYDNTIIYTDYVVSKVIDLLQAQNAATAMLYLSDHGESLGENGIYLHGLPFAFAPNEQTHVPMEFWASKDFYTDHDLDKTKLLATRNTPLSQDYLFHSMLGLFKVKSSIYKKDLDLFSRKKHT